MTVTKTVTWKNSKGNSMEVKITVTKEMRTETFYADGWNVESKDKKMFEFTEVKISMDGKFIARGYHKPIVVATGCYTDATKAKIESLGGYAMLSDKVVLREDTYNEIMEALEAINSELNQDQEVIAHEKEKAAKQEVEKKAEAELKKVEVPAAALKAYDDYKGSLEAAWADQDERAWALIEKWTPYIESQNGMHPDKLADLMDETRREQNFGIKG